MSLQERINRSRREWLAGNREGSLDEHIAAGLERDYYLVKLADLPEVTREGSHWSVDGQWLCADITADDARHNVRTYAALALHLQSRESEAAALQARRDELVHQYGYELTYADQSPMVKDLINRLISANADHTRAGEGDV